LAVPARFAELGYRTFAGVRKTSEAESLEADSAGKIEPVPLDVTRPESIALAIATDPNGKPIIATDPDSTSLLYASNFRAGTIDVYDTKFHKVTSLPTGAFSNPDLPKGYAPFGALRPAKPCGAMARPHGESSSPREIRRAQAGEALRRDGQAPRRIEFAARDQTRSPAGPTRAAVQVEHVQEPRWGPAASSCLVASCFA
jgi:hypothetical protein